MHSDWVYRQAITPTGLTHPGSVLTLAEVRQTAPHVRWDPTWSVAPHPSATPREAPRELSTERRLPPPSRRMTPVSDEPLIPDGDGELGQAQRERPRPEQSDLSRGARRAPLPFRTDSPVSRRQRAGPGGRSSTSSWSGIGYPPAIFLRMRRPAHGTCALCRKRTRGDAKRSRRDARSGDFRQPASIRHPGRRRPGQARATGRAGAPGMKASALRAAVDRGRLRAIRGSDGQWRSSRTWVEEYLASRYRRSEMTPGTD